MRFLGNGIVGIATGLVVTILFYWVMHKAVEAPFARLRQRMHAKPKGEGVGAATLGKTPAA